MRFEMAEQRRAGKKEGHVTRLSDLRNVGKATLADFAILGIDSLDQLAACDAGELYMRLERQTGAKQDPCVWDVFAAAIHQARTGEARNWWEFTSQRKGLQELKQFPR
jgi:hypothetical protein